MICSATAKWHNGRGVEITATVRWNDDESPEDADLLQDLINDAVCLGKITPSPSIDCAKAIFDYIDNAMVGADAALYSVTSGRYSVTKGQ